MSTASTARTRTVEQARTAGRLIVGVGAVSTSGTLAWTANAAASSLSPVVVVHAWSEDQPGVPPVGTKAWYDVDSWQRHLAVPAQVAVDALEQEGITATMEVSCSDAAEALLALAAPDDQIIVGASQRGAASRVLHGYVVHELARWSPCPVAVIPATWEPSHEPRPRFAVGWDGSEGAHDALRWAAKEAHRVNGRLVLVRAFRSTDHTSASSQTAAQMLADARSVAAERDVTDIRFARIPEGLDGAARALDEAAAHTSVLVLGAAHATWLTAQAHADVPERAAALASCPVVIMPR